MLDILMSDPTRIIGASPIDLRHARSQWRQLIDLLKQVGCQVQLLPECPYISDFFAVSRHGFVLQHRVLLGYRSTDVMNESSPYLSAWCQLPSHKTAIQVDQTRLHPDHKTPLPYAGHADTLYIDDCIYFGYGGHSAHEVANDLITKTGKRVVDLFVEQPDTYLIDAILPVHDGMVLCHESGLHRNSHDVLSSCFTTDTLQDSPDDYPSHSLVFDEVAIVPDNCYETQRMLGEIGYTVHPVDVRFFQSIGLGPRGLILPLLS